MSPRDPARQPQTRQRFLRSTVVVALAAVAIAWFTIERHADGPAAAPPGGAHASAPAAAGFHPTIEHTVPAPAAAPDGMVWIPGGEFAAAAEPFKSIPMMWRTDASGGIIPLW